jgi:mannosyltransferase
MSGDHDKQKVFPVFLDNGSTVRRRLPGILLTAILVLASMLRIFQLGQSSLWYDEVVTMRLARTEGPPALLRLLDQIDATRAPLQPVLLQCWVSVFGPSDLSGRSFSALCGILAVAVVYWAGLMAFDATTGLWAAWLCAISPLLVYYSREVRMYAWLVLVTCLAWGLLFSQGRSPRIEKLALYALALIAIAYSHPLGLLMVGALGLASFLHRQAFQLSGRSWLLTHLAIAVAIVPWVGKYLDHAPESISGLLSLRFLLGMPIGFIGGNFRALLVCSLLIAYGLCGLQRRENGGFRFVRERAAPSVSLGIWLLVPPVVLYAYSHVAHPIFGPARYTLFVGPAYLILVARGLRKLAWPLGIAVAAAGAVLSGVMLRDNVYRPDLKADWREAAAYLDRHNPGAPVAILSADASGDTELETARYYLGPDRRLISWTDQPGDSSLSRNPTWVAFSLREGRPVSALPSALTDHNVIRETVDFPGLRLLRVDFRGGVPGSQERDR